MSKHRLTNNKNNTNGISKPSSNSVSVENSSTNNPKAGPTPTLKVVLLGDLGVGKTCLRSQFVHHVFTNAYKATIGGDYLTTSVVLPSKYNNHNYCHRLHLWTLNQTLQLPDYRVRIQKLIYKFGIQQVKNDSIVYLKHFIEAQMYVFWFMTLRITSQY